MNDSQSYYNSIANVYDKQSQKRIEYLNSVDNIVIDEGKNRKCKTYLDIGAGNGRRSLKIASELEINDVTLIDNSINMLNDLSTFDDVVALDVSIFDFDTTKKFDLITCLWNVVGHFSSKELMKLFFDKINNLLSDKGIFIFDVNNRYNINHYGNKSVMENLRRDAFKIKKAGWYTIGNNESSTKVYIHSPFEIDDYLEDLDLFLENTYYIDYQNGAIRDTFFEGQLLYMIIKTGV